MRRGQRRVSDDERRLWQHVMRDTVPIHMDAVPAPPPVAPPAPPPTLASEAPAAPAPSHRPAPGAKPQVAHAHHAHDRDSSRPISMDRRHWRKLERGQLPIDARLDLHGLTQEEAHAGLRGFIAGQQSRGARCVLIITGQGHRNGGILRKMTPRWLDAPTIRPLILAYAPAHLRHGGDGALYVMLRRSARKPS